MLACTFFRNFASYAMGAFQVLDVWPLVGIVDASDFIHGEALLVNHEIWRYTAVVRTPSLMMIAA